jgi:hypothetical protein
MQNFLFFLVIKEASGFVKLGILPQQHTKCFTLVVEKKMYLLLILLNDVQLQSDMRTVKMDECGLLEIQKQLQHFMNWDQRLSSDPQIGGGSHAH